MGGDLSLRPRMRLWAGATANLARGITAACARTGAAMLDVDLLNTDRLLDAAEVAALLGVPKSWVYAETRAGRLPHVRVGRYRRYRRDALNAWIADHELGPVRDGRRRTRGEGSDLASYGGGN